MLTLIYGQPTESADVIELLLSAGALIQDLDMLILQVVDMSCYETLELLLKMPLPGSGKARAADEMATAEVEHFIVLLLDAVAGDRAREHVVEQDLRADRELGHPELHIPLAFRQRCD